MTFSLRRREFGEATPLQNDYNRFSAFETRTIVAEMQRTPSIQADFRNARFASGLPFDKRSPCAVASSNATSWRELVELYRLTQPALNLRPRYNFAPTPTIDVVRSRDAGPDHVPMRWGLIPGLLNSGRDSFSTRVNATSCWHAQVLLRRACPRTRGDRQVPRECQGLTPRSLPGVQAPRVAREEFR
jgi:hypothetical protein